jgi:hypothetical protein
MSDPSLPLLMVDYIVTLAARPPISQIPAPHSLPVVETLEKEGPIEGVESRIRFKDRVQTAKQKFGNALKTTGNWVKWYPLLNIAPSPNSRPISN